MEETIMKDTLPNPRKQLKPSDEVVQSLMNLRDELNSKITNLPTAQDCERRQACWKINSCLYSGYPTNYEKTKS
jgi:hypothetical protein